MENIKGIIEDVENGKIELEGESYDVDGCINYIVPGYEIEVFFAEKEHDAEHVNDLSDMYDYDKVVAFDDGSGIEWI